MIAVIRTKLVGITGRRARGQRIPDGSAIRESKAFVASAEVGVAAAVSETDKTYPRGLITFF